NLIFVFFVCGLWHGASWTFVAWGLYHGTFLILERQAITKSLLRSIGYGGHVYTFLVVMLGWVLFRAENFQQALTFYQAMLGLAPHGSPYSVWYFLSPNVLGAIIGVIVVSIPISIGLSADNPRVARLVTLFADSPYFFWLIPGMRTAATMMLLVGS